MVGMPIADAVTMTDDSFEIRISLDLINGSISSEEEHKWIWPIDECGRESRRNEMIETSSRG